MTVWFVCGCTYYTFIRRTRICFSSSSSFLFLYLNLLFDCLPHHFPTSFVAAVVFPSRGLAVLLSRCIVVVAWHHVPICRDLGHGVARGVEYNITLRRTSTTYPRNDGQGPWLAPRGITDRDLPACLKFPLQRTEFCG